MEATYILCEAITNEQYAPSYPAKMETSYPMAACGSLTDEQLVELTALGRREALETLHDRYLSKCQRIALRIVGNPDLAEEIVQDVFLKLWADPFSFKSGRGKFSNWLFTLIHNRSIDELRSTRNHKTGTWISPYQDNSGNNSPSSNAEWVPGTAAEPYEEVWRQEQRKAVHSALNLLSTHQREALKLAYLDGLTQKEVAQRLDVPLGTIKTRTSRGLFQLRGLLAAQGMTARNYED
jgi:RNA polymerase sigma-70 factor, ECF subfamily